MTEEVTIPVIFPTLANDRDHIVGVPRNIQDETRLLRDVLNPGDPVNYT